MIAAAYLVSYFLSVLANSVAAIALPLVILTTTGSVLGAGTVAAATAVPALLAGLLMGVVIDRTNRRSISIFTDVVSAVAVAALPFLDLFTDLTIGIFVVFGVIGALGDIPGQTARETLLPAVVRHTALTPERLIGTRESLGAIALVLGPGLAGVLIALLDGTDVLWFTAALSLAAAAVTTVIPRHLGTHGPSPDRPASGWKALREGWTTVVNSPFIRLVMIIAFGASVVLGAFQGLIFPAYFTATGQDALLGLVLSALAVGLLVGSGIYALLSRPGRGRRGWLSAGLIGATAGFAIMASLVSVPVMIAGAFVGGIACGLFTSLVGVLTLERIPDQVRGRVLGTQNALMTLAPSTGVMISAVVTELAGLGTAAIVAAGVWAAMTLVALTAAPLKDLSPRLAPPSQ
ncbi:MFS transporter [Frigoribacterium sp. VKM Ac-2836]|uniref:MFS transporter n=1 Tax=Frigoribacterium sp. VKM Ac-2836 TaxID=2739014 RepID=UPI0015671B3D|nr:MFS transporter [Frigoribacterium sp. VKM Ac-2836]NRD27960.1 MFS transporter [Frigoribacterium sp. VKM Ac-2836]